MSQALEYADQTIRKLLPEASMHTVHRVSQGFFLERHMTENLVSAVRQLREHLRESQQAFATRLGLSIRAIANYEKDRSPTGRALVSLAKTADEAGRRDLSDVFLLALGREIPTLGWTIESVAAHLVNYAAAIMAEAERRGAEREVVSSSYGDSRAQTEEIDRVRAENARLWLAATTIPHDDFTSSHKLADCTQLIGRVQAENAALKRHRAVLAEAAEKLLRRMASVQADPKYQTVWAIHQIHHGEYTGPKFDGEIDALKQALAATEAK